MMKRYCLLLAIVILLIFSVFACGSENVTSGTSVGGSVLELGYEVDENFSIVSPQTTFKADEDFYFSFYNNEPFGNNDVTIELLDTNTDEILAEGIYEVDPEWDTVSDMIWFSDPGKYKISIKVGDQVRATQEVTIE